MNRRWTVVTTYVDADGQTVVEEAFYAFGTAGRLLERLEATEPNAVRIRIAPSADPVPSRWDMWV